MKSLINISIDDISPHPKSSLECLEICRRIIKSYRSDVKFTLYIPMAYWRRFDDFVDGKNVQTKTKAPLYLYDRPDFCKALLNLPEENFELCYHGLYHSDNVCNNNEFEKIGYEDAVTKFEKMFEISKSCGLYDRMKPIFRPPNFRASPEAIRAAHYVGFKQISLLPDERIKRAYNGAYEAFGPQGCSWMNIMYPFREYGAYKKSSIVFHACAWSKNYLDSKNYKILASFLDKKQSIEFCFAEKLTNSEYYESSFFYCEKSRVYKNAKEAV